MTHYLKCTQCQHLNEISSEYQVFCSKCGQKLENNYTAWKQRNSDMTFNDFKKAVCITDADFKTIEKNQKQKTTRGTKFWVGFIASMIVISVASTFGSKLAKTLFHSDKVPAKVLTEDWQNNNYSNYGLSLSTPYLLIKSKIEFPDHVKAVIQENENYQYTTANNTFYIMVNMVKYNPAVGEVNLEGAANGSINEIKFMDGISDLEYTQDFIQRNEIPGFIQHVSCNMNMQPVEFINCGFTYDLTIIQVLVGFQKNDDIGRESANRIIESIKIAKPASL